MWELEQLEDIVQKSPIRRSFVEEEADVKFLLIYTKRSYTDVYIDSSSTPVTYHVYKGKKVFYVEPGTPENIAIYKANENKEWIFNKLPINEGEWKSRQGKRRSFRPATLLDSIVFGKK
ncbi:unnamed protein product [Caenorhabditis brenneri]